MADFLTIDDIPVEVVEDSGEETSTDIGDSGRAINGDYLQNTIVTKREWQLQTPELTQAAANTLYNDVLTPGVHTISGIIVNDVDTECFIHRDRRKPIWNGTEVGFVVTFRLVEK